MQLFSQNCHFISHLVRFFTIFEYGGFPFIDDGAFDYQDKAFRPKEKKEAGTKVLASQLSLDYRARRSG